MFVVSCETGETPVPLLNLGGTGFQPVVSGVLARNRNDAWTETYANPEWFDWFLQHSR